MKELVEKVMRLLEESKGYLITDDKDIEIEDALISCTEDGLDIMYDNDEIYMRYDDIINIVFDEVGSTIIATIFTNDNKSLLVCIYNE